MKTNPIKDKQLLSKIDFENVLINQFGLKVDYSMICIYVDTFQNNQSFYTVKHPKVFTVSYVDRFGFGWANTQGEFYKNHTSNKTQLYKEFTAFLNNHTFKHDNAFLT